MEKFITPEEAGEQLKVKAATVKTWLRSGDLKGVKFGKQWRIKENDWLQFLETGTILEKLSNSDEK